MLFVLAPLVGEYVLGNIPLSEIRSLVVLAPMYGGGALLIREVARRTGRGWPPILVLGLAYGVLEAGLLDQSLFNPSFEGYEFQAVTPVPALGISALNGYAFVVGHAVWSIGVPIALIEALAWRRRRTPWLGRTGLIVFSLVFVAGSVLVFLALLREEGFMATPGQRIGAAAVVLALVVVAFLIRPRAAVERRVPKSWLVGLAAFVVSSVFVAVSESWAGFGLKIALTVVAAAAVAWWGRSTRWSEEHRYAVAAGALLTYTWLGWFLVEQATWPLVAHAVLVLLTWALLFVARQPTVRVGS